MKALAQSVITAALFLAVSDDQVVDPDAAVRVLEDIGAVLRTSTTDERSMLRAVLHEQYTRRSHDGALEEELHFLSHFMSDMGLDDSEIQHL